MTYIKARRTISRGAASPLLRALPGSAVALPRDLPGRCDLRTMGAAGMAIVPHFGAWVAPATDVGKVSSTLEHRT